MHSSEKIQGISTETVIAMQSKRKEELLEFCRQLGITMNNLDILNTALTHTSYAHEAKEQPRPEHNERIEFLGDSVLSIIVSTYMYKNFPKLNEGELTKLRAHIVCETSLAQYAHKISLGKYLRLGKGEDLSGGRNRASILADALGLMKQELDFICEHGIYSDYKTRLQEVVQKDGDVEITYELIDSSGPEHNKSFTTVVSVAGRVIGKGIGHSKKEAEQHAAKSALEKLKK